MPQTPSSTTAWLGYICCFSFLILQFGTSFTCICEELTKFDYVLEFVKNYDPVLYNWFIRELYVLLIFVGNVVKFECGLTLYRIYPSKIFLAFFKRIILMVIYVLSYVIW